MSETNSTGVNPDDSGEEQQATDPHVLPDGGEIHFHDDRDVFVADRVVLLNGFVKAINKQTYECRIFPAGDIRGVFTHTNHLEDKEWW